MEIRRLSNNEVQVSVNGIGTILYSYDVPVAAHTPEGTIRTNKQWSMTTSKHINRWLNGADAKLVDQEVLNNLLKGDYHE